MAWIPQVHWRRAAHGRLGLIDIKSLGSIRRLSRFEFWLCLLTTVGVLGLGVLPGIVFAVTLAILRLLYSIYQHRCRTGLAAWDRRPGRHPQIQGRAHRARLVVYRFDDAILFFNADYFKMRLLEAVQSQDQPKAVLFDAEAVTNIDVSGIAALREVRDTLAAQGIFFAIARARGTFLRMLVRSGMAREMEDKLLFGSVRAGIRAYRVWRNRNRSVPAAEQD